MTFSSRQSRSIFCSAIIIVITFAAFCPSLHNGFTNWDDPRYVTENPFIQGFSAPHIAKQFSWTATGNYHPLTMLTYMADYAIYGLRPAGYHFTNLLFHILNALLVFAFIAALSKNQFAGLVTAMLFAVHPLRVESVAWIAERKDVLSSFFLFLALWSYVLFLDKKARRYYFGALALLVFSLLAKPMAVTLPFVFLLIDFYRGKKLDAKSLLAKWPFFVTAIIFSLVAYEAQLHCGALAEQTVLSLWQRFSLPFFGMLFYLFKTIAPLHLSAFYPYDYGGFAAHPLAYLTAGIALAVAAFLLVRHSRGGIFGLLFYLITLLPVLQIVPLGTGIAAERYAYVPSIGIFFPVALGCVRLLRRSDNRLIRTGYVIGLCLVVSILSLLTARACEVWKDSISLWQNAIAVHPGPLAYDNLGNELQRLGRNDEAAVQYRRSLAIYPNDPGALCNLGNFLLDSGRIDAAMAFYRRAISANPDFPEAHVNLGNALGRCGRGGEAIAEYRKAMQIAPTFTEAFYNYGTALLELGRLEEACGNLRKALELNPNHPGAHLNLGTALLESGKTDEAIAHYRKVLENDPNNASALENLGMAYIRNGKSDDAIACLKQAFAVNPSKIAILDELGNAFLKSGIVDSSIAVERKAMGLARSFGLDMPAKEIGRKIDQLQKLRARE